MHLIEKRRYEGIATPNLFEVLSRLVCGMAGIDPDKTIALESMDGQLGPQWMNYEGHAQAVIKAIVAHYEAQGDKMSAALVWTAAHDVTPAKRRAKRLAEARAWLASPDEPDEPLSFEEAIELAIKEVMDEAAEEEAKH